MPEFKTLTTITNIIINDMNVAVNTFYNLDSLPNIIKGFIAELINTQDGVNYKEGELVFQAKNSPNEIDFYIDNKGNLIISSSTNDVSNYSIDSNGNLIYTF